MSVKYEMEPDGIRELGQSVDLAREVMAAADRVKAKIESESHTLAGSVATSQTIRKAGWRHEPRVAAEVVAQHEAARHIAWALGTAIWPSDVQEGD